MRTPLYEQHVALGARMTLCDGWELPSWYAGVMEEHRAVRASAGAFDLCHTSAFRVFGAGALEFLQRTLTNDLTRIAGVGGGQSTLACGEDGGVIDTMTVFHSGDVEYLVVGSAANRGSLLDHLSTRAPADVEFVDESDRTGLVALQGPMALAILAELGDGAGGAVPEPGGIAEGSVAGTPVLVARTGRTGEDGVELFCAASTAIAVWQALMSVPEVMPCGLGAAGTLRLEMGRPAFGAGLERGVDPVSAGMADLVAFGKGEFIGREAVAQVLATGPARRLVGLSVADGIPRPGCPLLHGGVEVGKVASGTFSPSLRTGIAIAYLPPEVGEPGTVVDVVIRRKTTGGIVETMPFVRSTSLSAGS